MPGDAVPFRWISELPAKAQRELERNFLALQQQITTGLSIYDAIIDSELATSLPAKHQYKNLTDLVANETIDTLHRLNVGVKQGHTAITEPGSVSIPGNLALFGIGDNVNTSTPAWQWLGVGSSTMNCLLQGLHIDWSQATPGATGSLANQGTLTVINCFFEQHIVGFNHAGVSGQQGEAWSSTFNGALVVAGSVGVGLTAKFYNCDLVGGITANSQITVRIIGGSCSNASINITNSHTFSATCDFSGGAPTINASGAGAIYIENTADLSGGQPTVTAAGSDVTIVGQWSQTVHFDGTPAAGSKWSFLGSAAGLFVNGGVNAIATLGTAFVSGRLTVQGASNMIQAQFNKFTNPAINFVGATHSQVRAAALDWQGPGSKMYAFDSASHNNLLIVSGAFAAGFSTASTDAGTNNRVITEISDTLGGTVINWLALRRLARPVPEPADDPQLLEPWGPDQIPGPRGPKGKTGNTGAQGLQGVPGKRTVQTPPPDDVPDFGTFGPDDPPAYPPHSPQFLVPRGAIMMWGSATIPVGWHLCDGTALKRTEPLFQIVGTTFGAGDGSTTFNLPDFRDRVARGHNTSALGATDGATTHSHGVGTIAAGSHTHPLSGANAQAEITFGGSSQIWQNRVTSSWNATQVAALGSQAADTTARTTGAALTGNTDATTPTMSGSTATATGPIDPGLNVNYIIKL